MTRLQTGSELQQLRARVPERTSRVQPVGSPQVAHESEKRRLESEKLKLSQRSQRLSDRESQLAEEESEREV